MAAEAEAFSYCPHCKRETPTLRGGACIECWQPKSPEARPVVTDPGPKTERFFDFSLDIFELFPGWGWFLLFSLVGGTLLVVIGALARALLFG